MLQDNSSTASLSVNPDFIAGNPVSNTVKDISLAINIKENADLSSTTDRKFQQRSEDCQYFQQLMNRLSLSNIVNHVSEPDISNREGMTHSHHSKMSRQKPGELVLVLSPVKRFSSSYKCPSHS